MSELSLAERIARVENGLLAPTTRRAETPTQNPIHDRMSLFNCPGVSVAVIENHEIAWAKGYGVKETGKPEPVTTKTLFQAGSISKPVAAMGVLCLVQQGKLNLDEDVNTYLTSWKVPSNGTWQPRITLRQLLSHTAGMTVHGFPGYPSDGPLPTVIQILDGERPANTSPIRVNILPGTQFRYSGGGTTIAQQVMVDVFGKPFPEIMRELVLDPLGMQDSTYEQPLPPERATVAATAHPGDSIPLSGKWHVYPEMAAAGLWTTASDLARFAIEIQLSLQGKSNKVLSMEMVEQMLTPQIEQHIGIGPFLEGSGDTARFGHGGADEGFVSDLKAHRTHGQGIVVMVNSNYGWALISEIERTIATEFGWPDFLPSIPSRIDLDTRVFTTYSGTYELRPGFMVVVTVDAGRLKYAPMGQSAMELFPTSDTSFLADAVDIEVTFVKSDSGAVEKLVIKQNGREMEAKRC